MLVRRTHWIDDEDGCEHRLEDSCPCGVEIDPDTGDRFHAGTRAPAPDVLTEPAAASP